MGKLTNCCWPGMIFMDGIIPNRSVRRGPDCYNKCPMTFAEYMDQSLYGPEGYYASRVAKSGRSGDYFTAPDVSPVLGRLLAGILVHWATEFASRPFHLVEMGAGEGRLAGSIGKALAGDHQKWLKDLDYVAVERSPARRLA